MILKEMELAGRPFSLETGRMAKQADGSVIVRSGDTVVLVTVVSNKDAASDRGFFPLSVDYREKTYAAGRIPGGFFKREGRLTEKETLACRIIDRPIRPLFPEGYMFETQVIVNVLSADPDNAADVLGITGASAALSISDIPFDGPIAAVRIGKVEESIVVNPTQEQMEKTTMDIVVVGRRDSIVMVEGESNQISESELVTALQYAQEVIADLIDFQAEFVKEAGKTKREFIPAKPNVKLQKAVAKLVKPKLDDLNKPKNKADHYGDIDTFKKEVLEALAEDFPDEEKAIKSHIGEILKNDLRMRTLDGVRADGRKPDEIRPITTETPVLPRTHGSALFTRGETQALAVVTLGTKRDEQMIDDLHGTYYKNYMLHYNFPPFSVGEARPMRGTSRREIGHGNLAERTIAKVLPSFDDFPYTIRIVSEVLESNGSSSMATVCGACVALMDAGVPLTAPVAGIAMGLIKEGDRYVILSDILGTEDHLGDMDFKVAGTAEGINAIQMDLKIEGLSIDVMTEALEQARVGRLHILGEMLKVLPTHRDSTSKYAPKIQHMKIDPETIGALIGPGGKNIKAIMRDTGCGIDVDDDGIVVVSGGADDDLETAIRMVKLITSKPDVGATYTGTVVRMMDFGVFVSIAPGRDGLVHKSQYSYERIDRIEDHVKIGDTMEVKLLRIDDQGRLDFSRKALLEKPEGYVEPEPRPDRGRRDNRGGNRGGRGPRRR